jgi:hypothetical protein
VVWYQHHQSRSTTPRKATLRKVSSRLIDEGWRFRASWNGVVRFVALARKVVTADDPQPVPAICAQAAWTKIRNRSSRSIGLGATSSHGRMRPGDRDSPRTKRRFCEGSYLYRSGPRSRITHEKSFRLYRECAGAVRLGSKMMLIAEAFPIRRLVLSR